MRGTLTTVAVAIAVAVLGATGAAAASPSASAQTGASGGGRIDRFNEGATHSPRSWSSLARPAIAPAAAARVRQAALASAASTVEGIDVASFQHPNGAAINWTQVAEARYKFAFIKVSEGSYYTNPYYSGRCRRSQERGHVRGAVRVRDPELLRRRAPGGLRARSRELRRGRRRPDSAADPGHRVRPVRRRPPAATAPTSATA